MKKSELFRLAAGGLIALFWAPSVYAQTLPPHTRTTGEEVRSRGNIVPADSQRLAGLLMVEDEIGLLEKVIQLEVGLSEAQAAMEDAEQELYWTRIEAAGGLLRSTKAQTDFRRAQAIFVAAKDEFALAKNELKALRLKPRTQENNIELTELKLEIVRSRDTLLGARADREELRTVLRTSLSELSRLENSVVAAESLVEEAQRGIATYERKISLAHVTFDSERERVEILVAKLSGEQVSTFYGSLKAATADKLLFMKLGAEHLRTVLDDGYDTQQVALLAKGLKTEASFLQVAAKTGDGKYLIKARRAMQEYLAEIDRVEAEKFDNTRNGKSAFGIASGPRRKKSIKDTVK